MSGCFKVIRWLLGLLVSIVLFVVVVVGIPATAIASTLSNRASVRMMLRNDTAYAVASELIVSIITQGIQESAGMGPESDPTASGPALPSELSDELLASIETIFPKDTYYDDVDTLVDGVFDWLEGKTDTLSIELATFTVFEEGLDDIFMNMNTDVMLDYIEDLPVCSEGQDTATTEEPCRPAGTTPQEFLEMLESGEMFESESSVKGVSDISDYLAQGAALNDPFLNTEDGGANLGSQEIDPETTRIARTAFSLAQNSYLIFGASVIVLALIVILIIPGFGAGMITTGATILISGGLVLIPSFLGMLSEPESIQYSLEFVEGTPLPPELGENVLAYFLGSLNDSIQILALIVVGISFLMLATGIGFALMTREPKMKAVAPSSVGYKLD